MLLLAEINLVAVLDGWCPLLTVVVLAQGFAVRWRACDVPALRLHPAAVSLCLAATVGPAATDIQDCPDLLCFGFVPLSVSVRPH